MTVFRLSILEEHRAAGQVANESCFNSNESCFNSNESSLNIRGASSSRDDTAAPSLHAAHEDHVCVFT